MAEFVQPTVTSVVGQIGDLESLRADSEQQQQQSHKQALRRFMNLETNMPEEEITHQLTTEIKTNNKLVPRAR